MSATRRYYHRFLVRWQRQAKRNRRDEQRGPSLAWYPRTVLPAPHSSAPTQPGVSQATSGQPECPGPGRS